MPTNCSRLSWPSLVNSGASSWHGTHHEAQTLTTLTLPLNTAGSSPGTWAPLLTRPTSGGSAVCGVGCPIRAEGIFDGSPPCSRSSKIPASAANAMSGNAISQDLINDLGCGDASDVEGSLIGCPQHCARSAGARLPARLA